MSGFDSKTYAQQLPAAYARTHLESLSALDIDSNPHPHRMTGVICTIGPASQPPDVLEKLMNSGMSIVRMNFSHGSYEYHKGTLDNVRDVAAKHINPVAIALDTKGPEIRTGVMKAGVNTEVELVPGNPITVWINDDYKEQCDVENLYIDYKNIVKVMQPGKRIYIEDGNMSLIVNEIADDHMKCTVEFGGMISSKKGCNLPQTAVDLPAVSEKDKDDIVFGVEQGVDMIFASFIRSAAGVNEIREILGEKGKRVKIISKIETHDGVKKINEIIDASDGIMVARGDLGTEIPPEKVFVAQKLIIARCNRACKPVVCATQMLESMNKKPRPTRAEGTDVANAVLDGADCVMLSGESAKGLFPVVCVEVMSRICKEAESAMWHRQKFEELRQLTPRPTDVQKATCMAAVEASLDCMACAIICLTSQGRTAQLISTYRPRCPIICVTRDGLTARQLRLNRGCVPLIFDGAKDPDFNKDVDQRVVYGQKQGVSRGLIRANIPVVIVTGQRPGPGNTNQMRIMQYQKS